MGTSGWAHRDGRADARADRRVAVLAAQNGRLEFLLTSWDEISIVRPPFGKSTDFLEPIPSKFLIFHKVDPRPVLSTSRLDSTTGNHCRLLTRQRTSDPFERMFK
jgi:hypothetical protein